MKFFFFSLNKKIVRLLDTSDRSPDHWDGSKGLISTPWEVNRWAGQDSGSFPPLSHLIPAFGETETTPVPAPPLEEFPSLLPVARRPRGFPASSLSKFIYMDMA